MQEEDAGPHHLRLTEGRRKKKITKTETEVEQTPKIASSGR
jgi:hypothetical protein